jgi:hypothetical protein
VNEVARSAPTKFKLSKLFRIGLALFVIGSGPLLVIIALAKLHATNDSNPNPVGPGILVFLTFWPSIALILGGLVLSIRRRRGLIRGR